MCRIGPDGELQECKQEERTFHLLEKLAYFGPEVQEEVAKSLGCSVHTVRHFWKDINTLANSGTL